MTRLAKRVAVITGAASGIGRSIAIRFAREGAAVVIADLDREGGESTVRDCREAGGKAISQLTDVSCEDDVKAVVDRAVNEFGRLDIMVNNAGLVGAVGRLEDMRVENWDRSLAILLRGVFLGIKYAAPQIRKVGGGSIISTASINGVRGVPGVHAYGTAKAGVIHLTRSAALELAKDKIRVNCICPGMIATPAFFNAFGGEQPALQVLASAQPWPRAGRPEDIAATALFLASDDSEFLTGQAIVVDGGKTLAIADTPPPPPAISSDEWQGPSFQKPPSSPS